MANEKMGETLTHWTIRLALICLAVRLAGQLRFGRWPRWFVWSRGIWTLGYACFVLHVACAFHFDHAWSHALAFESTAEQTQQMLGVRFGEGIYFSYLFTILWGADVFWQWAAPESYQRRSTWLGATVLAYMAFIAFNGAVIFEGGVTRWIGIPVTAALAVAWVVAIARNRSASGNKFVADSWPALPDPPASA
jgi:hypothetical protein